MVALEPARQQDGKSRKHSEETCCNQSFSPGSLQNAREIQLVPVVQVVKDAESTVVPGLLAAGEARFRPKPPFTKPKGVRHF